ncbi:hypothetical protein LGX01_05445 [Streptococcus mutans]|uniref:hypothetical protein n=1 Tax=Streptococcus mutans TaxID=1309 RepID=UPI001CFC478E|nr:hypothetical protein [Streptococcus mutans]MCB4989300.1 hypothetical protein [Streptococcus mutans]MCB5023342.1 hypothetical protein [Streptococcus mutans]MCB5136120.1 hypothetical protein [Streptococcus mutans]
MVKKIDFHIHTIPSIKDSDFTYSSKWLIDYTEAAELDAIAITNHDLFDKTNYEQVKSDIPNVKVFPGMELTLDAGHVNIVFSEEQIDDLEKFSHWLKQKHTNQNGSITCEELCHNLNNWDKGIYIFELGKSNGVTNIPNELNKVTCVGGVRNSLRFQVVQKLENSLSPVLFSDGHATDKDSQPDRNDIDKLKNKNTYIQVDTCNFSDIKNCISDKTKVSITKDNLQDAIEIDGHKLSTGLNLVVGKRGTGKTYFLNKIKEQFDQDDIYEIAQFETAKADDYITKTKKEQGQSAISEWKNKFSQQFTSINEYLEIVDEDNDDEIDSFLDSVKKFAKEVTKSKSQQKFNFFKEVNFEKQPTKLIEESLTKLKELIENNELWSLLKNSNKRRSVFIATYNELRDIYVEKEKQNKIKSEVNKILDSAKAILESNTGITRVQNCELSGIIKRQQIENKITEFLQKVIVETDLKKENIHGYQIIVQLVPFESASQFQSEFSMNEKVKEDIINPYLSSDYITFLKRLKNKNFYNNSNLAEYFMHKEVKLLDSDGTPASGGQAVGFTLMMRLNEARNKPIILIDEPEASLDNAYIQTELNQSLRKLSNTSMVVVVTHNSTLGALLQPDYLVVTTKNDNGEYTVLTGEFSSHIISDSSDLSENSYEKFVEAMESGIESYKQKGKVYGNLKK